MVVTERRTRPVNDFELFADNDQPTGCVEPIRRFLTRGLHPAAMPDVSFRAGEGECFKIHPLRSYGDSESTITA
jgi:hypothetical protein